MKMCVNVLQCTYSDNRVMDDEYLDNLVCAHYREIELSEGVYVVNIGGNIGTAVTEEIQYAKKLGKEIRYHESV